MLASFSSLKLVFSGIGISELLGERTTLITRFRRACPGSERTSDGYIQRPIVPPFPREWGRVDRGSLVAASCIPDRDKESVQL